MLLLRFPRTFLLSNFIIIIILKSKFVYISFSTLEGHDMVRAAWRQFHAQADAIIFMVDSADAYRFAEAKEVYH